MSNITYRALLPIFLLLTASIQCEPLVYNPLAVSTDDISQWIPLAVEPIDQISVKATVNGQEVSALLDTGATRSIIDSKLASTLGIKNQGTQTVDLVSGPVPMIVGRPFVVDIAGRHIDAGGVLLRGDTLDLFTSSMLSRKLILGRDVLSCCVLEVDNDARLFRLSSSKDAVRYDIYLPLEAKAADADFTVNAFVGGGAPLRLVIDLGFDGDVMLSDAAWGRIQSKKLRTTDTLIGGLGRTTVKRLTTLPKLHLGSKTVKDVEVYIEHPNGYADARHADGLIGIRLLKRFNFAINFKEAELALRHRAIPASPNIKSTSGVLAIPHDGELSVAHIMSGSPAARSQLRSGDRICRVNGNRIPLDYYTSELHQWSTGRAGSLVRLELCDGRTVPLTLADFY